MRGREQGKLVQGLGLWAATAPVAGNIIGSGTHVIPASPADRYAGYPCLNALDPDLAEAYPTQGGYRSTAPPHSWRSR